MAGPIREGGGGKGRAIREKRTFFEKIVLPLKNKNYFTLVLIEIWTLKFVGRYFYWVVTIFPKK